MILNIYPDDEDNYDQEVYDDGELLDINIRVNLLNCFFLYLQSQ